MLSGSNRKLRPSTTRIIPRRCLLAVLLVAAQIGPPGAAGLCANPAAPCEYKCSSSTQCQYPGCNDKPCSPEGEYCVNGYWTAACYYVRENRVCYSVLSCPEPPPCAAGNYSRGVGKNGGGDYACQQCPPGKFQTETGASVCTDCPAGKFSETRGASSQSLCKNCFANFDSPAGSTSLANCTCAAGFFGPSGGPCAPCPTGTYKDISGSAAACTPCPLGQSSPKASAYANNCIFNGTTTTQRGGSHKTQTANWIQIMFFVFGMSLVHAQCD